MLKATLGVMRDFPRLQEITGVLIRHGLGDFVRRLGLAGMVGRAGQVLGRPAPEIEQLEPAQRVRLALQELGPTFVKLGQLMATRVDLFPPEWTAEFEKLHSDVAPVPFEQLLPELTVALGGSPFDVFRELDTRPAASASIAQVHLARLQDGTAVVLKIRRPGIRAKMMADLRLLAHFASMVESEMPEARRYRPVQIAHQIARSLERELDLAMEARNIERFRADFAGDANVVIPRVFPQYTHETLNVQEHIVGIPGTDPAAMDAAGLDRKLLAARGAAAILKMILVDGFFHADPHPGNVFYLPGNRLVMIDFGMVGRLSRMRRDQVIELLYGIAHMNQEPMIDVLMDWAGDAVIDEPALAADVSELMAEYHGVPLKDIRIGTLLRQFAAIIREHSIVMPPDLILLFKALITMEGLGRQYDPDFHVVDHLQPLLARVLAERMRPRALFDRGRSAIAEAVEAVGSVPRDIARLVREARRGKLRVDVDVKRLERVSRHLDATMDRLTMGILTASLVIGSSIVMNVREGPQVMGVPVLTVIGFAGYLVAFLNSAWIIFGIWRETKRE
jgi:ubiquinone biosynthesis protein